MTSKKQLTDWFKRLGAEDPAGWASSQVEEGIPQFARFVFLKAAWENVISESNDEWIDRNVDAWNQDPEAPYAGAGRALERMLASGVSRSVITDLVRAMQAETLFGICCLLDGASVPEFLDDDMPEVDWLLIQTTDDADGPQPIIALHESVLETDPTGREMRPRPER
ncbi:MAG: hypothetical protein H6841_05220 [Planctomycetes bacterium]|nr:hypothetical protein [Planctomycetota bacterium]MCB9935016.1 hypothetical protein [Planctomycetota bacterium]